MTRLNNEESLARADGRPLTHDEVQAWRERFPMLKNHKGEKPFVYLNSAATSLKPDCVIEAIDRYYREYGVNVFRGVDSVSYRATEEFEATRRKLADFVNASKDCEIVFTRNTTAALNFVCCSYGESFVRSDNEIVVSGAEHHANFIPWQQLAKRKGARFVIVEPDPNGVLTPEKLRSVITDRTALIAVNHISNVMGGRNDLKELAKVAHEFGAILVADGAQGILHEEVDVQDLDVDFYAFSGHKLYGPTGVGVLYGKEALLSKMPPVEFGGEMIDKVSQFDTSFADPPHRFEAGTPMIAEVIGLGAAIDFVREIGYPAIRAQISALAQRMIQGLKEIPDLHIYNEHNAQNGIVTFNINGVHAHDAASVFDRAGISLRAGQHCNQPTLDWLCEVAVLRASLAFFNTEEEVDYFIETARKAGDFLDALF